MAQPIPKSPQEVVSWIQDWLSHQNIQEKPRLKTLAGDGSPRVFYRVQWDEESRVLIHDPYWTFSKDYPPLQRYLAELGLPVPRFDAEDSHNGVILMEDLGDTLLQEKIVEKPSDPNHWLAQSIDLLADLHIQTHPLPSSIPAAQRRFDTDKLFTELMFTHEQFHCEFLGLSPWSPNLVQEVLTFCEKLQALQPWVFCHRDYHSRNIMVRSNKLFLIDFQDARLGPAQYDLCSLLYDAYITLKEPQRDELLGQYQTKARTVWPEVGTQAFSTAVEKMALQRTLKATGSFASFFNRYGKNTHLRYIRPALKLAEGITEKYHELPRFPFEEWLTALEGKDL